MEILTCPTMHPELLGQSPGGPRSIGDGDLSIDFIYRRSPDRLFVYKRPRQKVYQNWPAEEPECRIAILEEQILTKQAV